MRNAMLLIGAESAQRNYSVFKREEFSGDRPRGIAALALAGLFGLLNSAGCGSSSSANEDANQADTFADSQQVTATEDVPDASMPFGPDAPVNASIDAPVNASIDAPANASVDAPVDAFVVAPVDASVCTPADGGMPGTTCGEGEVCSGGICQSACGVGQTLCTDGICHDLMNENANCGWCGSECSSDKQCIGGDCACIDPGMCPL